jgi:hypothetical protein
MKHLFGAALAVLPALCLLAPATARAAESYDACTGTIAALPATIGTPGTWCVKQNLATAALSGNAITINANDVTLDCNGFRLDGSAAGPGTNAKGVYANNRSGVTIRNCSIRGFNYGVAVLGTGVGNLVERNRVSASTYNGIRVEGDGSLVRDNQVTSTGGSTVTPHAFGIFTRYIVDVLDNTVSGVAGTSGQPGAAIGIYTYSNTGGTVGNNRVSGVLRTGTTATKGIYNYLASRVVVQRNTVAGDGTAGSVGLSCTNSTSRAKDNAVGGFATGISGCGDAGRNDVTP